MHACIRMLACLHVCVCVCIIAQHEFSNKTGLHKDQKFWVVTVSLSHTHTNKTSSVLGVRSHTHTHTHTHVSIKMPSADFSERCLLPKEKEFWLVKVAAAACA
jgi:hypothetical protein